MIKLVSQNFAGILFLAIAAYIAIVFFQELPNGGSSLLLAVSAFIIALGAFFIVHSWRDYLHTKAEIRKALAEAKELEDVNLDKTLEKNNAMDSQWKKTNDQQNKLKLLQISAAAEE